MKKNYVLSLAEQWVRFDYTFYINLKLIFEYTDLLRDWKWTFLYRPFYISDLVKK